MKDVSAELEVHLNTEKTFTSCDLYELVLANGNTYRYADCDCDIVLDNRIYRHDALIIKRQQINLQGQVTVDTLAVTIYADGNHAADTIESMPIMAAAHSGVLDGAKLSLKRAFFRKTGELPAASVIGTIGLFSGEVEIKSSGGIKLELTIKSKTQGLNMEFPRRRYYPQGAYTTAASGRVTSSGDTDEYCLIAPFVPRKEVLL